ncbi:hypothetical protein NDU88_005770 [Pleurodeles waltl]|uniref:Uncharacterized protein n=1 Tax=Pleurodeles waltl TaxID=8319 RepID=A0AAV7SMM9_PLEWA|nr:hypothetical protein NDU88_005770 [Pleurodeles waltl]
MKSLNQAVQAGVERPLPTSCDTRSDIEKHHTAVELMTANEELLCKVQCIAQWQRRACDSRSCIIAERAGGACGDLHCDELAQGTRCVTVDWGWWRAASASKKLLGPPNLR